MTVARRTPGPASANLQGRKPREGIRQAVRRALSKIECRAQFRYVARGFSKNLGLEYVHNFGVMARVLLTGESRFLSSCDFKELRVIKRARFTTLTLAASQHSFCSIARTEGLKKNFDAFKLKLFRFAGQDNHRISDCADLTSDTLAVPT